MLEVRKGMMTHGCMLWGAALYNNGAVPAKWSRYGESYSTTGVPQRMQTVWKPVPVIAGRRVGDRGPCLGLLGPHRR